MARNPVAANLLMLALLVGGWLSSRGIKQEVFPEFDLDVVTVSVPYQGASPEEVELGIIQVVEEAVRGHMAPSKVEGLFIRIQVEKEMAERKKQKNENSR